MPNRPAQVGRLLLIALTLGEAVACERIKGPNNIVPSGNNTIPYTLRLPQNPLNSLLQGPWVGGGDIVGRGYDTVQPPRILFEDPSSFQSLPLQQLIETLLSSGLLVKPLLVSLPGQGQGQEGQGLVPFTEEIPIYYARQVEGFDQTQILAQKIKEEIERGVGVGLVIGGGGFTITEMLQLMAERSNVSFVVGVEPDPYSFARERNGDPFQITGFSEEVLRSLITQASGKEGVILPVYLQDLYSSVGGGFSYIEIVSPDPANADNLVNLAKKMLKPGGELYIWLPLMEMYPWSSSWLYRLPYGSRDLAVGSSSILTIPIGDWQTYYQSLFPKEEGVVEVEMLPPDIAAKSRESAHFGRGEGGYALRIRYTKLPVQMSP